MYRLKVKELAEGEKIIINKLMRMSDLERKTVFADLHKNIDLVTLDKISIALNVDISALVEGVKEE
jgi:DNA-binding Xre family transcriptional regulator